MVAKTTQSGFTDIHRDEFRTLADTTDRILATSMSASWAYARETRAAETRDFVTTRESIRSALLATFINHYSRSIQETLYKMAQAALAATDTIDSITLTMPNKHHIPFNLPPFDRANDNEIFVVTDNRSDSSPQRSTARDQGSVRISRSERGRKIRCLVLVLSLSRRRRS